MSGEAIDPNANILEGVEQEVLGYREWKKGRTRKITNIDEDISPDLDLQETGVSRLATPDEVELFTSITTTGH